MGLFKSLKKIFKSPIFKVAAPVLGYAFGGPIGAGLAGAASGAAGGGGIKGAAIGGLTSYLGTGGFGSVAGAPVAGGVGPTQGSGLLGALTRGSNPLSTGLRTVAQGAGNFVGLARDALGGIGSGGPAGTATGGTAGGGLSKALGQFGNMGGVGNLVTNAYSTVSARNNADKIAKAQSGYTNKALDLQRPFMSSGLAANTRLAGLLGLDPDTDKDEILDSLRNTPGYQFRLEEGTRALDRSAAARGSLFSGQTMKELEKLGIGLADQTYNDYVDDLTQQQGMGVNTAGSMGSLYQDLGNIQGNRLAAREDALNKGLSGVLGGKFLSPEEEMMRKLGLA
jgi:hypothetical protein